MSKEKILRHHLCTKLRDASVELSSDRSRYSVHGRLRLGDTAARLEIIFHRRFKHLVNAPPEIFCRESWLKREIDWHAYSDHGLCWVLPQQWRDIQAWPGKPKKLIATDGANLLLSSAHSLLSRHRLALRLGLTKWPKEWNQWGHGREGIEQYAKHRQHGNYRRGF